MGTTRYLGCKTRLTNQISTVLGAPRRTGRARFVDFFSGTGAVSLAASQAGWAVSANDHLLSAAMMTSARLMTRSQAKFKSLGGYPEAIATLNRLKPTEGFFHREYSPDGLNK